MSYIPTDEQWAKMQKHIKSSNYKKDDFFVFETLAVGDKIVPNRYIKIMPDLLNTMKEDAEKGVSLMLNHNWSQEGVQSIPIGKVFDARIGEGTQEGESMALYTTQYILRDDSKVDGYSKNDIIKLIETGILADTSIGWGTTRESYKCSICQNSIYDWRKCEHIPGRKYIVNEETNEVKECIIEAHSPAQKHAGNNVLMENSIVFDGAYPNAIIQSKVGEKQGAKGEMLQVIEGKENLDVSENDIIIGYTSNRSINLLHKQIAEKGGMEQMSKVDKDELDEATEVETQANEVDETTDVTTEPAETTEVEIPTGMIETELDNMIKDMETRMSYQGIAMDQYLQMIGKTMEDFKKENEEQAKTSVKTRLSLEAIVKTENIEASEEEVNARIEEMSAMYGRPADELKVNEQFVAYVTDSIKNEAVVKFLLDNAKIK